MKVLKPGFLISILLLLSTILYSQATFIPYSVFGIGNIENQGFGIIRSLGGAGIALKSGESLNNLNPASYSGIDSLSFHFEFGLEGKYSEYQDYKRSKNVLDGSFKYIALGLKINKWWTTSIGITPYSIVGYSFNINDIILGETSSFLKTYEGKGGINQLYFGNSFSFSSKLSIGINAKYLFGSINHNETSVLYKYSLDENSQFNSLIFDYGLQYSFKYKDIDYSLGMILGNHKKLHSTNEINLIYSGDTLNITDKNKESLTIPFKTGIGIAVNKSNRFKAAMDYTINQWSGNDFENNLLQTTNSEKYSAGFEYNPPKNIKKTGTKIISYRLGGYYERSYMIINNQNITTSGITMGLGIPLKANYSKINFAIEYGKSGTIQDKLIKENYFLFHLNLSLHDLWFIKPRFD